MNPLVHGELGWLVGHRLAARRDRALVTLAGVLPDLDGLTLLAGEDAYARWHHLLTHGIVAATACAALLAAVARQRLAVAALAFAAFHLHLLCDLAGSGVGWPIFYLWPFDGVAVGWSGGWELASWQNTVIGLGVTLGCLGAALLVGRTPVELLSPRADGAVVRTLVARFGRRPS